jgi:hypothetical protein
MPSPSGVSNHALSQAYRQNTRQRTRAGLGTVISAGLAGSGLYYMAAPALVAGYGLNKSLQTKKQIEQLMRERGMRKRTRDKLAGILVGSAEKMALSFLLLGHDELAWLGTEYGLDPSILAEHTELLAAGGEGLVHNADGTLAVNEAGQYLLDRGPLGETNGVYNALVDGVVGAYGLEGGVLATAADVHGSCGS